MLQHLTGVVERFSVNDNDFLLDIALRAQDQFDAILKLIFGIPVVDNNGRFHRLVGFHRLILHKFAVPQFERDQEVNVAAQLLLPLAVPFQHPPDIRLVKISADSGITA